MPEGIVCFLLCFGSISGTERVPIDSYCATYVRVVKSKEELDQLLKLPRSMRNSIQGNDLDYLCRCRGLKDRACQQQVKKRE